MRTSLMFGTSFSTLGVSPSSAATIALVTRFLAPCSSMRPRSGLPPLIVMRSTFRPDCRSVVLGVLPECVHRLPDSAGSRMGRVFGPPSLSLCLELGDRLLVPQGEPDVVEPFEKPPTSVVVDVERHGERRRRSPFAATRSTVTRYSRLGLDDAPRGARRPRRRPAPASRPCLPELPRKMSPNRELMHDVEAVVAQRPHGVLAARAGAEVGARDEDAGRPGTRGR